MGLCQLIGSFMGSAAITNAFGRSAINASSGVKTPVAGVITSTIILLTCAFLSPYLAYIPTSSLSAVIIFAMFFTIEYSVPLKLWRGKKMDLIPYSLTFFVGLLVSVEMGLITGTLVHMVILIYSTSTPAIKIEQNSRHIIVKFQSSLYFPAKDHIIREITHAVQDGEQSIVALDMSLVRNIDYTVASGLIGVINEMKKKSKTLVICCANVNVLPVLESIQDKDLPTFATVEHAIIETSC